MLTSHCYPARRGEVLVVAKDLLQTLTNVQNPVNILKSCGISCGNIGRIYHRRICTFVSFFDIFHVSSQGFLGFHRLFSLHPIVMASQVLKRFIPLFDRVLIERAAAAVMTKAGIVIPDQAKPKAMHGKVLAVGEGVCTEAGKLIKPEVSVGDYVLLPEYSGCKVTFENKEYYIYRDAELLGKFTIGDMDNVETGQ